MASSTSPGNGGEREGIRVIAFFVKIKLVIDAMFMASPICVRLRSIKLRESVPFGSIGKNITSLLQTTFDK
jgi:hypothetical protein